MTTGTYGEVVAVIISVVGCINSVEGRFDVEVCLGTFL